MKHFLTIMVMLVALPATAAFFSIWHNISGPLLAGIWSRSATNKPC